MELRKTLTDKSKYLLLLKNNYVVIFLLAFVITASFLSSSFFTLANITYLIRATTISGIMAVGLTIVLITGNMDLSLGYGLSLTGMVASIVLVKYNYIFAIIACLCVGLLIGMLNGFLVGVLRGVSVIITLGTGALFLSLSLFYIGGRWIPGDSLSPYSFIAKGFIWKIPFSIIIFIIVLIIAYLTMSKSIYGKYVYATGCDESNAWLAGIKTKKVIFMSYVILGFCVGISGLILSSRIEGSHSYSGSTFLIDTITAVILGGTSLYGGRGSIGKTLIGVLTVAVLGNILILVGITYEEQEMFKGLVLILAILIDSLWVNRGVGNEKV